MKAEMNRGLDSFCKEIKSLLLCPKAEKEKFLSGLQKLMEDYLDDHPDATMEDLQLHFGKPEDIANSYQFSIGEAEVRKRVKQKKTLWYLLAGVILVLFVVSLVLILIYTQKATDELPEYYVFNEHPAGELTSIPPELLNGSNTVTI